MVTQQHAAGGELVTPWWIFVLIVVGLIALEIPPTNGCRNIHTQNPGYMKENFMICIESLHIADTGEQENVRVNN